MKMASVLIAILATTAAGTSHHSFGDEIRRGWNDAVAARHHDRRPLRARDVVVATNLPSPWSYLGCQADSVASRTLTGATLFGSTVTAETCIAFCSSKGFIYAGTEYSNECYCGNSRSSATTFPDGQCNMGCAGNSTQACGGPDRLSLYWSGQQATAGPKTNPGTGDWTSMGCYVDQPERTLPQQVGTPGGGPEMTVAKCLSACGAQNFAYAGLEYASECWCGNTFKGQRATDGRCNMICNGDSSEYCGGGYGLNVYGHDQPKLPVECPRWNNAEQVLDNGAVVTYECYADRAGGDLSMVYSNSYTDCASSCASTTGCVAFSWVPPAGGPCYMKSSLGTANANARVLGGRVSGAIASASSASASASSKPASVVSSAAVATQSTKASPSSAPSCENNAWDGAAYTASNGAVIKMQCFQDHAGGDLSMKYTQSYQACAELCSTTTGCKAFAWNPPSGGPCWMKSTVGSVYSNQGVWGGQILALPGPSASSSAVSSSSALSFSSSASSPSSSANVVASFPSSAIASTSSLTSSSGSITVSSYAIQSSSASIGSSSSVIASGASSIFGASAAAATSGFSSTSPTSNTTSSTSVGSISASVDAIVTSSSAKLTSSLSAVQTFSFQNNSSTKFASASSASAFPSSSLGASASASFSKNGDDITVSASLLPSSSPYFANSTTAAPSVEATLSSLASSTVFFANLTIASSGSQGSVASSPISRVAVANATTAAPSVEATLSSLASSTVFFANSTIASSGVQGSVASSPISRVAIANATSTISSVRYGNTTIASATSAASSSENISSSIASTGTISLLAFANTTSATSVSSASSPSGTASSAPFLNSSTTLSSIEGSYTSSFVSATISRVAIVNATSTFLYTNASIALSSSADVASATISRVAIVNATSTFLYTNTSTALSSSADVASATLSRAAFANATSTLASPTAFTFASSSVYFANSTSANVRLETVSSSSASSLTISNLSFGNSSSTVTGASSTMFSSSSTVSSASAATSLAAPPHWYYVGCYTDSVAKRALKVPGQVAGGNTIEKCQAACRTAGYLLAGTEYSNECYCDNLIQNNNGPAPDGEVGCNMACSGNSTQVCGGGNRLSLYAWSTWNSTASSATTTSTAPKTSASAVGVPANWTYAGCYMDNYGGNGRVMKNEQPDDAQMTIGSCITTCNSLGYPVAGMEYSTQCFCDSYVRSGSPQVPDTDCNMPCAGDSSTNCGAGDRLTVWSKGNLTVLPVPTIPHGPKNWSYVGCLLDGVTQGRPLPYKSVDATNNTVANCIAQCQKFGYPAAGVEYGQECYCGDWADIVATGPNMHPDAECSMPCAGNASELCGNGGRLQTYVWNSTTPLNDWTWASGTAAGQYKYLMGGPVIPLVTTFGVNGKVTFLEKFGTGPPNNTGAYEYDPSEPDYRLAWREMHVKSDVFCSASLTLPDKAGRQINIGGWSNDALSGIRLYTPDGSPGTNGTNDWIENPAELKLIDGRWYPTAMILANGTILVVGGQDGSNGPPVPTLELLPRAGGTLYMDWLKASDPWNLYPFLAVMRGGIFVQYWNEARILDEHTFETIRILPPVPAAVNDITGGRTYPLEGTMVLLPQHAPYTDSLEVLICGGSTKDNAAIDNCISTKPEDPNADWVIERMPSKRVMPCITALPDGTYLINNGAQEGVAGFELAGDPNLNAVLYDPRKPVGSRMTIMANTTLARMYHSESILLNDGRVMVSGSDPLDARFPEQYTVEQFLPPYLLNGKPRPTFTATTTDWSYGASITITGVTAPNAGTGRLQISMLGAVSSTHSNSMGQRTLFPTVSCTGSTCTITAPPEAHIAPPGWFQVFAVDDGQPSEGIWVRLGGDPAALGTWPNLPDFKPLPGV